MGRPIGKRILQVREIVKELGQCTARQVGDHMPEVDIENVHKYCSRAVGCGLISVDRTGFPKKYTIVDKIVDNEVEERPRPAIRHEPHALHGIWR